MEQEIINISNLIEMKDNILKTINIFKENVDTLDKIVEFNILPKEDIDEIKKIIEFCDEMNLSDFNICIDFKDGSVSQYVNFINNKLLEFNEDYLISKYYQQCLNEFFKKSKNSKNIIYSIKDYNLDKLKYEIDVFPETIQGYINKLMEFKNNLELINKFKTISNNIVIVGRNGSGKSTLSREFKKIFSGGTTSLSAQRVLYCENISSIPISGDELRILSDFQNMDKVSSDFGYINLITSDMEKLMTALISEHSKVAVKYIDDPNNQSETLLMRVRDIWNSLIKHRQLNIDKMPPYITYNDIEYTFNELSDGEKAIFYFIGHILTAQENSYIIIDEPENHLHPAICNEIWDRLEEERRDCKFIYITHNLSFATGRNATILWNKKFVPPYNWDVEIFPQNSIIPNQLFLEILGSRKTVCFCEGDYTSLDYRLYSTLFPNLNIIPVNGHREVISYVDAINKIESKDPMYDYLPKAIGIVDGDYYNLEQKEAWKKKRVFPLSINEVENILVDESLLSYAVKTFAAQENSLAEYYCKFWKKVSEKKETLAINFVKEYIHCSLKESYLKEKSDINKLQAEYNALVSKCEILKLYDNKLIDIDDWINSEDYESAMKFFNLKNCLIYDLTGVIVNKYPERMITKIKEEEKLRNILINKYFNDDIFKN